MKAIKNHYFVSVIFLFSFQMLSGKNLFTPNSTQSDTSIVIERLYEFYTKYITENSKHTTNYKNIELLKSEYCTNSLLQQINSQLFDFDPFINGQDCDIKWLKTLTIITDQSVDNAFIISYFNINERIIIKVKVIKYNNKFYINEIL